MNDYGTEEEPEFNSFLYKYLQLAYEYINQYIDDSIQGSPVLFRKIHQKIASVFDDPSLDGDEEYPEEIELDSFQGWFRKKRASHLPRLIEGNLGDFKFNTNAINDQIESHIKEILENNLHQFNLDHERMNLFGLDTYATYLPLHFFYDGKEFSKQWGIYISEAGVIRIAAQLYEKTNTWKRTDEKYFAVRLVEIAFEILLRHELEHFKIESFALNAELSLQKAVYTPYLMKVYANCYPDVECLEEAAANTTVLDSVRLDKIFKKLFKDINKVKWNDLIKNEIFNFQPACYRNTHFSDGWPKENDPYLKKFDGYFREISNPNFDLRRRGMNYLCNQIVASADPNASPLKHSFSRYIPYFAFFPDNYFLRAENLVPIHVIQSLDPDECVIGFSTPKEAQFLSFIRAFKFEFEQENKHESWKSPLFADKLIISIEKDGSLNQRSYKNALRTLGVTNPEYLRYQKMNKSQKAAFVREKLAANPQSNDVYQLELNF